MDFIDKYHLKSSSFFDTLSVTQKKFVKNKLLRKEYLKGEYLFREKTFPKGLYIIKKGKVKIFQTNVNGKESVIYIYKKGDYFGYRPLLANEPHPVSAVAMDNVVLSFLPKDVFFELLNKSTILAKQLLVNLSKEFSVWVNKMTLFTQYPVKKRVALSLLILNQVYALSDNKNSVVKIAINRDDFSGFVGVAKETLVRALRILKDEKIIITKGTKITILKHKLLISIISKI